MNKKIERIHELRKLTGLGMKTCKELLEKHGTNEEVLTYLKNVADEPEFVGSGEIRYDVFKDTVLVFSCKSEKELMDSLYGVLLKHSGYSLRALGGDGKYSWVQVK